LRYAKEYVDEFGNPDPCPWNSKCYDAVVYNDDFRIFKYLTEHVNQYGIKDPCPYTESFIKDINENVHVVKYGYKYIKYFRDNL